MNISSSNNEYILNKYRICKLNYIMIIYVEYIVDNVRWTFK